jgi:hypothetical protein
MRIVAYYPLHYGAEYLNASIKSIEPFVDKIHILYTENPSYGFHSDIKCPETEQQLKDIVFTSTNKANWHKIKAGHEGQHRDIAFQFTDGYDLLLACDADEVWEAQSLDWCLQSAMKGEAWRYNIRGFINFWKSFNHHCIDYFAPARIFNLHRNNKNEDVLNGIVYHFSCAQSKAIMDYKWTIHGHKNEIHSDWLNKTYYQWKEGDKWLHPASKTVWEEALPFDKNTLPEILKQHSNFNKKIIS